MNWTPNRVASVLCGLAMFSPFGLSLAESPIVKPVAVADPTVAAIGHTPVRTRATGPKNNLPGDAVEVEMFRAMADGQLAVDYIAKDATQANLIFRNQTAQPLKIKLPETFGAVHVLAQGMGGMGGGMGGMGGGMGGMGGGMGGGGGQGMGGGMGGMGGGGGMDMGGMFRVDVDKPRKMPVATLCLEHGKLDPTPRMTYKVVPLEVVNADPQVVELCRLLGQGRVSQNSAQAAAWHIANGLTWEELLRKPRVISKYTGIEMFFSHFEVQSAIRLAAYVKNEADEKSESSSSSDYLTSDSSNDEK